MRNEQGGDRSPGARKAGLENRREVLLARKKTLNAGASKEGQRYFEMMRATSAPPESDVKDMPDSTKAAGE